MHRRGFIGSLAAFSLWARAEKKPLDPRPAPEKIKSAGELLYSGKTIRAVQFGLLEEDFLKTVDLPLNRFDPFSTLRWEEVPQSVLVAQCKGFNVSVSKDHWIDCDDVHFRSVTGNNISAILVGIEFENGDCVVIAATDNVYGLPCTPNGGDIIFTVPLRGIVRLG